MKEIEEYRKAKARLEIALKDEIYNILKYYHNETYIFKYPIFNSLSGIKEIYYDKERCKLFVVLENGSIRYFDLLNLDEQIRIYERLKNNP